MAVYDTRSNTDDDLPPLRLCSTRRPMPLQQRQNRRLFFFSSGVWTRGAQIWHHRLSSDLSLSIMQLLVVATVRRRVDPLPVVHLAERRLEALRFPILWVFVLDLAVSGFGLLLICSRPCRRIALGGSRRRVVVGKGLCTRLRVPALPQVKRGQRYSHKGYDAVRS
jgi:hypothetical protein